MTIPEICKLHSQNLTHNIRLAKTDEEWLACLSSALQAFGEKIVPHLNQLAAEHFESSPELESARTAALELATVICGNFVRKCTDYGWGVAWLEKVSAVCTEPQLKNKLVFYTNQLKKRWNIVEPGGLAHNPRAKRIRTEVRSESPLKKYFGVVLFIGLMLFVLVRIDLKAIVFPAMKQPQPAEKSSQPEAGNRQELAAQQSQESPPPQAAGSAGALYTYTDKQGVVHMVDNLDKVPAEYRRIMKVDATASTATASTPVVIRGNQVIVPVTITFRGRSVATHLLLDTGATVTTISTAVAAELGVGETDVKAGKATVADGRSVASHVFKADSLSVADHAVPEVATSILPGSGGRGYDGLLGMNYLRNFRYHVNFDRSVIEWGG